jgi:multicomponent Na+:H+ antiporter subunit B
VKRPVRLGLFLVAAAGLLAVLVIGFTGLPSFGHAQELYGAIVNRTEPTLRHATDIVTALNFDIRAFDTQGEEFILFVSVAGVTLLLRQLRGEDEQDQPAPGIEEHTFAGASDGLRLASLILIPLVVAFGFYLVFHGQLTPGGGFQGGVVLAGAVILTFASGQMLSLRRTSPVSLLEAAEAAGAAAYALVAIGGLVFSVAAMANFLGIGTAGSLLSGGTVPVLNVAVGIEVGSGITLILTELLDQALLGSGSGTA